MFGLFKKTHSQSDQVDIKENSSYSERQKTKHQKNKSDLIEYFHRGVDYSPKERQALNKFLDGVALKGYKFFHSCYGNKIMVQEVTGWQQKLALPINYDRYKKQMSVDKDYTDLSYDCAMTYNVVQPLIEQFNKEVRGEKMAKDLSVNLGSDKRLLLIKKLIKSHLDFYLYNNDCDYKQKIKTPEEWRECKRTLHEMESLIEFAFNKIKEESITWNELGKVIDKQIQDLNELDTQLRDMTVDTTKGNDEVDKIYVPLYDNGEPYEDNVTYPESVCFKNYSDCVKWIENQSIEGVGYERKESADLWQLVIDQSPLDWSDIPEPYRFYTIHEMKVKD